MKPGTEWYPWYPRDYRDKTLSAGLTRDEHGGYRLLIDAYYLNGGPLPDDDKKLAVIVLSTAREWRTKLRPVMAQFFQVSDGQWHHKRIDEELERRATRHEERHKTATKAARLRWKNGATGNDHSESENPTESTGDPMPEALPEHCLRDSPGNACAIHNLQEDYHSAPYRAERGNLLHSAAFAARQNDSAEGAPLASPGGPRGAPQPTSHKSKRSGGEPGAPPWEQRCRAWAESGFWMEMWGPEPSEAGCYAPGDLVAEACKARNGHVTSPPPRTPEDSVAVDALVKETLVAIKRKAANANGPVSHQALDNLDAWVGRNLDGDERTLARKAIEETRKAGDDTPPAIRKLVDAMDELRRGQTRPSAAC